PSGKTGTPTAQTATTPFTVTVNAVDANWNVVSSTDTVGITSSNGKATLPRNAALVAGTKTFSVTLKTAGTKTLTATDITDVTKTANTSPLITVNPGALSNFLVEAAGGGTILTQTAGSAFSIKITARDANNNTVTGFTGTATITSTGTLSAGGTTVAFTAGVLASHSVTISNTGSFTLTATSGSSGTSNAFTVNRGALNNFLVEEAGGGEIGTQTAGTAFNIRITAREGNNKKATGFTGTATITSTWTLSGGGTTASFTPSLHAALPISISNTGSFTLTATNGSSGTSNAFTVGCAAPASDPSYVSANGQNLQATVYWSSSNPVLILRKTAAFAGEKPTDGTTYTAGNTGGSLGTGVVQFVGSATELLQTSLANATTYYYKVFSNEASCYSPGIAIDTTPAAPVATQWSYATTAASMAPPGLDPWSNVVVSGSNDDYFH